MLHRRTSGRQEAEPLTLEGILADQKLRMEFRDFADERGAMESFLFYESIEIFEDIDDQDYRNFMGAKMVSIFVMKEAQYPVNIGHDVRTELVDKVKNKEAFHVESFSRCKAVMKELIVNNVLPQFRQKKRGERVHGPAAGMEYSVPTGGSNRIMRMLRGYTERRERNWQMPLRQRIMRPPNEPTDSYVGWPIEGVDTCKKVWVFYKAGHVHTAAK